MIRREFPGIAILVLSAHVEVEHAMGLLASGRSIGCLLKARATDVADFVTAPSARERDVLARVAQRRAVCSPSNRSALSCSAPLIVASA